MLSFMSTGPAAVAPEPGALNHEMGRPAGSSQAGRGCGSTTTSLPLPAPSPPPLQTPPIRGHEQLARLGAPHLVVLKKRFFLIKAALAQGSPLRSGLSGTRRAAFPPIVYSEHHARYSHLCAPFKVGQAPSSPTVGGET